MMHDISPCPQRTYEANSMTSLYRSTVKYEVLQGKISTWSVYGDAVVLGAVFRQ